MSEDMESFANGSPALDAHRQTSSRATTRVEAGAVIRSLVNYLLFHSVSNNAENIPLRYAHLDVDSLPGLTLRQYTALHVVGTSDWPKLTSPGAQFLKALRTQSQFLHRYKRGSQPTRQSGAERLNEKRETFKLRGYSYAIADRYLTQRTSRHERLHAMEIRHEKNVKRKLRAKERKNAIVKSLRAEPLRPINTRGLQTLQQALGLPLDPYLLSKEARQDNFEPERLEKGAGSRARLSNFSDVVFTRSTAGAISEPTIPTPGDFDSQEPEPLDAIFIAIDFEYSHYSAKTGRIRLREVRISMLDTRDLCHQNISLKEVISAQHYRTVTDTKTFLFGKSVDISQDELVLILKRLFHLEDGFPKPTRDLILVGHGLAFEVQVLKGLGIDLNLVPSLIEMFDTQFLGHEVFGKNFKCNLSNVVRAMGISGGFFHNAGNDANFSPRAMILLACYRYDTLKTSLTMQSRLGMYRKLAQF
ncbi:hypothetical protein DL98DRAFT_535087 [Cadophora sp. DSE1049]|nr:hypothetical protein DL98DRAFT_535087 [Cadophora sp. DSE1049]